MESHVVRLGCHLSPREGGLSFLRMVLSPLRVPWGCFACHLGSLADRLGSLGVPLGSVWDPLGTTRDALGTPWTLLVAVGEPLGSGGEPFGVLFNIYDATGGTQQGCFGNHLS